MTHPRQEGEDIETQVGLVIEDDISVLGSMLRHETPQVFRMWEIKRDWSELYRSTICNAQLTEITEREMPNQIIVWNSQRVDSKAMRSSLFPIQSADTSAGRISKPEVITTNATINEIILKEFKVVRAKIHTDRDDNMKVLVAVVVKIKVEKAQGKQPICIDY